MSRPAVKKQDIENAAIRLFATYGLAGTTIKDIANEADVTEGALYRYYRGKNDMAWELYRREAQAFVGGFKPILDDNSLSLSDRLRGAIVFIYEYYSQQPDRLIFVLLTRQSFPEQISSGHNLNRDSMVAKYIQREMNKGEIPQADSFLSMAMIRGMVIEPILMHRYGILKAWPITLADQVVEACGKVLGLEVEGK